MNNFILKKYELYEIYYNNDKIYILEIKVASDYFILKKAVGSTPELFSKALGIKIRHLSRLLKCYNNDFKISSEFYKVWFKSEEDANKFCKKYLDDLILLNKFLYWNRGKKCRNK